MSSSQHPEIFSNNSEVLDGSEMPSNDTRVAGAEMLEERFQHGGTVAIHNSDGELEDGWAIASAGLCFDRASGALRPHVFVTKEDEAGKEHIQSVLVEEISALNPSTELETSTPEATCVELEPYRPQVATDIGRVAFGFGIE